MGTLYFSNKDQLTFIHKWFSALDIHMMIINNIEYYLTDLLSPYLSYRHWNFVVGVIYFLEFRAA